MKYTQLLTVTIMMCILNLVKTDIIAKISMHYKPGIYVHICNLLSNTVLENKR